MGHVTVIVVSKRCSSMRMSEATGESGSAMNPAVCRSATVALRRQRWMTFGFRPCSSATALTDAPGCAHAAYNMTDLFHVTFAFE